ncbi:VTC domain-containing protein [Nannocystis pusilla]|uniref:VTC domain-containing protein n=1 Tax=Nannocystis pusilla TaxID=889268 RepID=UPI003B79CA4F
MCHVRSNDERDREREYKYLIDGVTAARLRAAIRPFCDIDPYAGRSPGGRYTIESLYLDSPLMGLYWANEHEQVDRIKMRVRGYAESPGSPVFFEVKRRINDVITKTRGRVRARAGRRCCPTPRRRSPPRSPARTARRSSASWRCRAPSTCARSLWSATTASRTSAASTTTCG